MNKIGIAFQLTSSGFREPIIINTGKWISRIKDLRSKVISLMPRFESGELTDFKLLEFTEEGSLVTAVHRIAGRGTDYMSTWMFVPNTVSANGKQLASVLEKADLISRETSLPPMEELEKEFSTEYPELIPPKFTKASPEGADRPYCAVDTMRYTMSEILGYKIFQPEYDKFSGVICIDNPSLNVPGLMEFKVLKDFVSVALPDEKETIEALGANVSFLHDDRPVPPRFIAILGKSLIIKAKRKGYESETFTMVPGKPFFENVINKPDWKKIITPEWITITGKDGKPLNPGKTMVYINNTPFTRPLALTLKELENASVKVIAEKYEPFEKTMDLTRSVIIPLTPMIETLRYELPMPGGNMAHVTVEGFGLNGKECPFKGYQNKHGELIPVTPAAKSSVAKNLIWASIGAAAMACILLAVYFIFLGHSETEPLNMDDEDVYKEEIFEKGYEDLHKEEDGRLKEKEDFYNKAKQFGSDEDKVVIDKYMLLENEDYNDLHEMYEKIIDSKTTEEYYEKLQAFRTLIDQRPSQLKETRDKSTQTTDNSSENGGNTGKNTQPRTGK